MAEHIIRVIQIMPANGWQAVYAATPNSDPNDIPIATEELVAWALVEHGDCCTGEAGMIAAVCDQAMVGLAPNDLGVCSVEDTANFLGYLPKGKSPYRWMNQEAERRYQAAERREVAR